MLTHMTKPNDDMFSFYKLARKIQSHGYREQTNGYKCKEGEGNKGVREWQVQIPRCKISSRM